MRLLDIRPRLGAVPGRREDGTYGGCADGDGRHLSAERVVGTLLQLEQERVVLGACHVQVEGDQEEKLALHPVELIHLDSANLEGLNAKGQTGVTLTVAATLLPSKSRRTHKVQKARYTMSVGGTLITFAQ